MVVRLLIVSECCHEEVDITIAQEVGGFKCPNCGIVGDEVILPKSNCCTDDVVFVSGSVYPYHCFRCCRQCEYTVPHMVEIKAVDS